MLEEVRAACGRDEALNPHESIQNVVVRLVGSSSCGSGDADDCGVELDPLHSSSPAELMSPARNYCCAGDLFQQQQQQQPLILSLTIPP